jgi:alginate O-acetyltransferase complex protein AlgI
VDTRSRHALERLPGRKPSVAGCEWPIWVAEARGLLFSSVAFLFAFLPFCLLVHELAPRRFRNAVLLGASLLFYAWGEGSFVFVLLASAFGNWAFGLKIERALTSRSRRRNLGLGIALNLALLFTYKYAGFFLDNLNPLLAATGIDPVRSSPLHLPIGISFFTFQAMSYLVDVYRRDAPTEADPVRLALYIALFPQLIAGPIVRYRDLASQLRERTRSLERFASGVERFILGLGKKVLIANPLAACADGIFALPPEALSAELAWAGAIAFGLQIYFDFSGYSDMAIGLGRMFGFELLENFRYPYIARSMTEFWRRWHISLSTWFRDYLYIPLGGNRGGALRTFRNLALVFLLCGLWHGARWPFAAWGLYHGVFLVAERAGLERILERLPAAVRHVYLLLVVLAGWVLFRSASIDAAFDFGLALVGGAAGVNPAHPLAQFVTREVILAACIGVIGATPLPARAARWLRAQSAEVRAIRWLAPAATPAFLIGLFLIAGSFVVAGSHEPFIYFRF